MIGTRFGAGPGCLDVLVSRLAIRFIGPLSATALGPARGLKYFGFERRPSPMRSQTCVGASTWMISPGNNVNERPSTVRDRVDVRDQQASCAARGRGTTRPSWCSRVRAEHLATFRSDTGRGATERSGLGRATDPAQCSRQRRRREGRGGSRGRGCAHRWMGLRLEIRDVARDADEQQHDHDGQGSRPPVRDRFADKGQEWQHHQCNEIDVVTVSCRGDAEARIQRPGCHWPARRGQFEHHRTEKEPDRHGRGRATPGEACRRRFR